MVTWKFSYFIVFTAMLTMPLNGDEPLAPEDWPGILDILKNGGQMTHGLGYMADKYGATNGYFPPAGNFNTFVYRFENINAAYFRETSFDLDVFKRAFCDYVKRDLQKDSNFYNKTANDYGMPQFRGYCQLHKWQ